MGMAQFGPGMRFRMILPPLPADKKHVGKTGRILATLSTRAGEVERFYVVLEDEKATRLTLKSSQMEPIDRLVDMARRRNAKSDHGEPLVTFETPTHNEPPRKQPLKPSEAMRKKPLESVAVVQAPDPDVSVRRKSPAKGKKRPPRKTKPA